MNLNINGKDIGVDVEPNMPLLWVLRDELNMTGTKFGCGVSACGACTVLVDGEAMRSCTMPVSMAEGKQITTIEGVSTSSGPSAVQQAWIVHQVPQCGYCQSGMILAAESLLNENSEPTDADIDEKITNICRCGTYVRARAAIHAAAKMRREANELLGSL
ncbi:MAG: (2Fe-2S)-binding protein [Bacteroidota bacterium]